MKRILGWMGISAAILLSACGGSVQSPDFQAQLSGIQVAPATANVDIGKTTQFTAQGLYSTPPGTSDGIPCSTGLCTTGDIANVSWSVADTTLATVDSKGMVTGVRRGATTITATAMGNKATGNLTVGGVVLQSIVITPSTASVALGRTQGFSAKGIYSDSSTPRSIVETVTWTASNTNIATVSPAQGTDTVAQSMALGTVTVRASAKNAEGDTKEQSATLNVTAAVLDQLQITPSTVSTPQGTTVTFNAQGVYSDSATPRQVVEDVSWAAADTTIATIAPAKTTGGNNAVVGTASSAKTGTTTVTASAVNGDGVTKTASANFTVVTAALTAITGITPLNPTVAQGSTQLFVAQGTYSDAPSTTRNVDPNAVDFTSSATNFATINNTDNAAGVNTKGTATAVAIGQSTITATIKSGTFPNASMRSASTVMTVGDRFCRVQYTAANATTVTPAPGATCVSATTGACTVTNKDNVISTSATDAASFNIAPALASYTLTLDVKQTATAAVTPTTGQLAGILIGIGANSTFNPSTDLKLSTLTAAGAAQETAAPTVKNLNMMVGSDNLMLAYIPVTQPFVGVRAAVAVTGATSTTGLPNPVGTVTGVLNNGGSVVVNAYAACSTLVP